jgi:hypothetical protein
MFHHVTLYRLRPGVTLDRVRHAREQLSQLAETLPGVVLFSVTHNVAPDSRGFTLVLFSAFESRRAYDIFVRHARVEQIRREHLLPLVADELTAQGEAE